MAIYTTAAKVRRESGFANNTDVVDADDITPHLEDAEGEVSSSIGQRYTLPLSANSSFSGSQAESMIAGIATRLASAFVLLSMYEGQGGDMQDMALKKLGIVRGRLKKLEDGSLKLFGTDGSELATIDEGGATLSGLPNISAEDDDTGDYPQHFTSSKVF